MSQNFLRTNSTLGIRILLVLVLGTVLVYFGGRLTEASDNSLLAPSILSPEISQLQQTQCLNSGQARSSKQASTGFVRFVGTDPSKPVRSPIALPATATAEDAVRGYLSACGSIFGINNQATDLTVSQRQTTAEGHAITRFQQRYQGIPVFGGETLVQTDGAKNIVSVVSKTAPNLSVGIRPNISAATARQTVLQVIAKQYQVNSADLSATQPELWIYSPSLIGSGKGSPILVWKIEVTTKLSVALNVLVLVDAQRGSVELSMNQTDAAMHLNTYTANDTSILPGTLICTESNPTCANPQNDTAPMFAHQYAADSYNFFFNNFGRDSIDGAGMAINSTVHYSATLILDEGAAWTGSQIIYNDVYSYTQAEDLVGHEFNHGVIQYTSKLYNFYQSGSIAESLSDLFGEFIQQSNQAVSPTDKWLFAEAVPTLGAVRSMKDPTAFSDPDKMTSANYYSGQCINSSDNCDNGWVHGNSGVNNKAAYLMVEGGTFNGITVTNLSLLKVAHIYYKVQTELLLSGSDYGNLYDALYQGCVNLIGQQGITSSDCQQVRNATNAVEMNLQPVTDYNPKSSICSAGYYPVNAFFDNMESGTSNWTSLALQGTNRWGMDSSPINAYSGSHALYANDAPGAVSDSYIAMLNTVPITTGMFLHFAHDYEFEYGSPATPPFALPDGPDGAIVEYTTDGGLNWKDLRLLFTSVGYSGQINSASNPLQGRNAFINSSHGYNSSLADLSTLAGFSTKFRWRMATDSTVYNHGWWLDDVRIYSCAVYKTLYLPLVNR